MKVHLYLKLATLSVAFSLIALGAHAQKGFFAAAPQLRLSADQNPHIKKLSYFSLKTSDLRTYLAKAPLEFKNQAPALALQIPLPDGTVETFDMLESPILAPEIAAKHPDIKTYNGRGQTHKNYTIRASFTALGFNAIILGVNGDAVYYDKVSTSQADQIYRAYFAHDAERPKPTKAFGQVVNIKCGTDDSNVPTTKSTNKNTRLASAQASTGTTLRNFRLALAADGEFTAHNGGNVNSSFAALVGFVNRLNAVYRVELSVHLNLVTDVNLVYANTATDPYTNDDEDKLLNENQANLDKVIGNAKYDVGQVLRYAGGSGGGVASAASVCDNNEKGRGVSGIGDGTYAPVFDDQTFTHEIGHMFGMSHSFNSTIPVCTTRRPATSVEPGAGATIMSYGFTCSGGDPNGGDNYENPPYGPILTFHSTNYDQANTFIATLSCYTTTTLANAVPVVTMPTNKVIPKSTPFTLTGTATDANAGNVLTYSWEGMNIGTIIPNATTLDNTAQPPFFRSYEPISTGTRTFPRLDAILNGTNQGKGDKLPSIGIVTTNRLTVRDGVGGVSYGEMTVTIDGNSGPFLETTNLTGSYLQNTAKTITWSVNNTTAAPVSCAAVNILLSTDGGLTFPTTLVANTPNDGSQSVTLPNIETDKARIKIAAVNNVFFDISNSNFSIVNPANQQPLVVTLTATPTTVASVGPLVLSAVVKGGRADYTYSFEGDGGYTITETDVPSTISLTKLSTGVQTFTVTVTDSSLPTHQVARATTSFTVQDVPLVGLTAPDPIATAGGTNPSNGKVVRKSSKEIMAAGDDDRDYATFKFQRSNPGPKLPVKFSISGSAIGNSVLTFADTASFYDGELDFLLYVYPGTDLLQNGDQTLTLTLIDEPTYDVLPSEDDATIYIKPDPNPPFAIATVTTFSCQTLTANQRRLTFAPQYVGLDGQPVTFQVVSELAATTAAGPYALNFYTDNPIVTLKATQKGTPTPATFKYNWLAACNTVLPPSPLFSITAVTTVSCQTLAVGKRRVTFTPQYANLNGQPVTFQVVNELGPTTAAGPYALNFYTDNPTVTLKATQIGSPATAAFAYNWLAACNANVHARLGTGASDEPELAVQLLGNPAQNGQLLFEVRGASGQSLQMSLTDVRGKLIGTHQVEEAGLLERHSFEISRQPAGMLLLRVSTGSGSQTVRVLKGTD